MKLSPHFDSEEFRCRCDARAHRRHEPPRADHLVAALERLRAIVGRPLVIVSGHRCRMHNRHVGGADRSRHVAGDAADIPYGYATVEQAEAAGFHGIGRRGRWAIHVDMRGYRARWSY